MANWQHPTVGELIDAGQLLVSDGYRARNEELGCAGTPFVRGGDIGDGVIDTAPKDRVKPQFEHRIASKLSRPGDTAFITKGTVGRAGFLRHDQPTVVFAPQVAYWRSLNTETLDPRFVFYFIRSKMFQNALEAVMTRGAMVADYVSIAEQRRFRVPLPPIVEQRQIGGLLGLLDDKIALNARMNVTLEAMARAVFEDWFVRFGPVRAKAEGRAPPGLAPDLAARFPDRLTETPEGEVPAGWRLSTIGQEADCVGGSTPSTDTAHLWHPAEHAWATPKDLAQRPEPFLLTTDRQISGTGLAGISSGLLPVGSVLLSSRAPIGYRAITAIPVAINQGFIGLRCSRSAGPEFIYLWLGANMNSIHARANGSTFMEISKASFRPIPLILPPEPIMAGFAALVRPMFERIRANQEETRTLTTLRDLLLPRLISGKLRLRDAERAVEAAL